MSMSLDESTLLAYADGDLPPARRAEVEAALAANAELARQVQALQASRLPYQAAFERAPLAPLPAALRARVEELSAVALASHGFALQGAGQASVPTGTRWPLWRLGAVMLLLGAALGYWSARPAEPAAEPWVRMVSSYHAMYGRETVLDGGVGTAQTEALKTRLQRQHGIQLQVPDLTAEGLRFVRAQQLQFEGRMVIQIVYLPAQGLPVALCLTPATSQPERSLALDGQGAVTWQSAGWAHVLVGQLPLAQLEQLRTRVRALQA
jgi:anti-sigma factor RsiW